MVSGEVDHPPKILVSKRKVENLGVGYFFDWGSLESTEIDKKNFPRPQRRFPVKYTYSKIFITEIHTDIIYFTKFNF